MRGLGKLTRINLILFLREPIGTFFTLAFPVLLVLLFGAMYGNDPTPIFGNHGSMDISMPAYSALILGTVGLLSVPITTGAYREQGVLRRFRASPLRPLTYITADVLSNLVMTFLGIVLLVSVGWLLYHVHFAGNVFFVVLAILLGGLSMSAIGYIIASLAPSARAAQIIGMVIFYPMMFLSGSGMPLEIMPESVRRISTFLPLTYVVKLLRGLWFGDTIGQHLGDIAILLGILVVGGGLAAMLFKWE
jgi:ABC-2 type transport system permease protein